MNTPGDNRTGPTVGPETPVWFITGCSRGLGASLAARVLEQGFRLIATARNPADLTELARFESDRCQVLALDVRNAEEVKVVVRQAAGIYGRLDVVVNNAGHGLVGALEEISDVEITQNFATNFFGPLHVIRAALPILRAQRRGHIVNISAAAAISNYPGFSIYGAAKSALEGMSEALAAEVRPLGIRVTLVQFGPLRTGFLGGTLDAASSTLADYQASSGKFQRVLASLRGRETGDPARAAEAIMATVAAETSPLRLVLGKYATEKVRRKLTTTARELEAAAGLAGTLEFGPELSEGSASESGSSGRVLRAEGSAHG